MSMGMSDDLVDEQSGVMNEINMTPLIDVMLVLLIIFIITLPVINHAVKLDLPKTSSAVQSQEPKFIDLSITANGDVLWNKEIVDGDTLKARIADAAAENDQPALHLYIDKAAVYDHVAKVLAAAQSGGLSKINFVTEPAQTR